MSCRIDETLSCTSLLLHRLSWPFSWRTHSGSPKEEVTDCPSGHYRETDKTFSLLPVQKNPDVQCRLAYREKQTLEPATGNINRMSSSRPFNRLAFAVSLILVTICLPVHATSHIGKTPEKHGQNASTEKTVTTPPVSTGQNALSQYRLGMKYYYGKGVKTDRTRGMEWLTRSARNGNRDAQYELYLIKNEKQEPFSRNSEALQWLAKAAENGHVDALFQMAVVTIFNPDDKDRVKNSLLWIKKAAEAGHPQAQNTMGSACEEGVEVEKNLPEALTWYEKSAAQGNGTALGNLARLYATGTGVPKNTGKAFELYEKALEKNDPETQLVFARFYRDGIHVEKNEAKAFELYQKSANQMYLPAITEMIAIYESGLLGQAADPEKAKKWNDIHKKIARYFPKVPQKSWSDNLLESVRHIITPTRIIFCLFMLFIGIHIHRKTKIKEGLDAYDKGRYQTAWAILSKKYAQKNPDVITTLGQMYLYGHVVDRNDKKALEYFIRAASERHTARFYIGLMFDEGLGVIRDREKAAYWYRRAAEGSPEALNNLGVLYYTGEGVAQNHEKAYQCFEKSADGDIVTAKANLACLVHQGAGVPKDEIKAFTITCECAETGHLAARYNLALYWRYVNPDKADKRKTLQMIVDCAHDGYRPAMRALMSIYEKGELGQSVNETLAGHWKNRLEEPVPIVETKALVYTVEKQTET